MKRVKLYGYEDCPYCQELKEYYEKNDIVFEYVDVDLEENKAEFKKIMEIGKTEISFKSIEEAFKLTKKFLK